MPRPPSRSLAGWLARTRAIAAITAVGALAACASIYGIDAPDLDLDGGSGIDAATDGTIPDAARPDGSVDGATADVADGSAQVDAGDAAADGSADTSSDVAADVAPFDAGDASVCGVSPDYATGVLVATTGADTSTCGGQSNPCLTIQHGIGQASTSHLPYVYVASGTYTESITLDAGVTVWGGWSVVGTTWTGLCGDAGGAVTIAPATSNVTVTANALGGVAELRTLSIASKPQSAVAAGETLYGIVATGGTTTLDLVDVDVTIGNGGNGAPGANADAGAPGSGCTQPGDGGPGTPVGAGGAPADAGGFGEAGYVPVAGGTGGAGNAGSDGVPGDGGTCFICVSCTGGLGCTTNHTGVTSCGQSGAVGCGGGGGLGGGGGGAGGSSIALFAWGATVNVVGGALTSGNGGNGAGGGAGGDGGAASTGATGANALAGCPTACGQSGFNTCAQIDTETGQGGAGSTGGPGSAGGPGGPGAGGWSYAVVEGGGASVTVDPASLQHGNYGMSPDGGASGSAGTTYVVP